MKKEIFILVSTLFIIYGGCVTPRYIYTGAKLNNPYFKEKGESKLAAYYSSPDNSLEGEHGSGVDIQGAYAFSKHFAVTASYFHRNEKDHYSGGIDYDSSSVGYKRNLINGSIGYFIVLNQKRTLTANLYGGVGFGRFLINDESFNNSVPVYLFHNARITEWFFQPSINFTPGRYVRMAFVLRSTFVHYGNVRTNYAPSEIEDYRLNVAGKTITILQSELNFQFGLPSVPWLKLDFATSGVAAAKSEEYDTRGNISIGLTMDFSKLKKKSTK